MDSLYAILLKTNLFWELSMLRTNKNFLKISVACSIILTSLAFGGGIPGEVNSKWWIKVDETGRGKRWVNYYEALSSGNILPRNYMGKIFGGNKSDFEAIKDGIGVVILSLDFDKKNGNTAWAVSEFQRLKEKYASRYIRERLPDEDIWNFIIRIACENDQRTLARIRMVLQDYSEALAPEPDDTCQNGFIGSWGTIDCKNKNLKKLRAGWKQLTKVDNLYLEGNDIHSFKNLSGLTKIGTLEYDYEKIQDFSGLSNLKEAKALIFKNNSHINNLDFLSNLTSIQHVFVAAKLPNLTSINGLSNLKTISSYSSITINGKRFHNVSIFLACNPNLSDISILQNVTLLNKSGRIYVDKNGYDTKLPADSAFCSSKELLNRIYQVDENGKYSKMDPSEKYEVICERLVDNGNIKPQNNCETGFDYDYLNRYTEYEIDCRHMGLEKLSSGWRHLKSVGVLRLNYNNITSFDNLSGLSWIGRIVYDFTKITNFDGISNITGNDVLSFGTNSYIKNLDFLLNLTRAGVIGATNLQNLTDINGLSNITELGKVIDTRHIEFLASDGEGTVWSNFKNFDNVALVFVNNPNLTDISGLKNIRKIATREWTIDKGRIYLDNKEYAVKIPATSPLCATQLLHQIYTVDGTVHNYEFQPIDSSKKYDLVCEHLIDNENIQPQNDCETGYSGSRLENIRCYDMGLERLSSGWKHLTEVGGLYIYKNNITSFENLSNLTKVHRQFIYDYKKITDFSGLSNITEVGHELIFQENDHITDFGFLSKLTSVGMFFATGLSSLTSVDGLSSLKSINNYIRWMRTLKGATIHDASLFLAGNDNLTDISGLKSITYVHPLGLIVLNHKDYNGKIPAWAEICSTQLLKQVRLLVSGKMKEINPNEKYDTICERIADDGNMQPQNNCETGFNGRQQDIKCQEMGLERLSSGWKHLTYVRDLYLYGNEIKSFSNLSGLMHVDAIHYDYEKITDFSGLRNLTSINYITLKNNPYIKNLDFLSNVEGSIFKLIAGNLPNLENVNGLSKIKNISYGGVWKYYIEGSDYEQRIENAALFLAKNPKLTDISGLKNIVYIGDNEVIYLDKRNYKVKLPASSKICSTRLLKKVFFFNNDNSIEVIKPTEKYNTICERLVDNGNIEPQNDCETGYNKFFSYIVCTNIGLERLSSGWLHLTEAGYIYLQKNAISDISNLKNITSIYKLYLDNKEYAKKLPADSWLCNEGFSKIKVVNEDNSREDPIKSNLCN